MHPSKKAIVLGLVSALFFAVTFVFNRLMSVEGGSWIWSSSLRFYWMLPFMGLIVLSRRNLGPLLRAIRSQPVAWLIWSTVGFGLFYAPLTYAAAFSPSWLIASTWQMTIIAGMLLAPLINKRVQNQKNGSAFLFSGIILLGVIIMQVNELKFASVQELLTGTFWILVAAFAYPLGNRKMMQVVDGKLDVYQRILGMIICSLPFWLLLNIYGFCIEGSIPTEGQYVQTLIVAIFSGVIATVLFFSATEKVRHDEKSLASVEATQSTEVLFALLGEIIILQSPLPDMYAMTGILLVIVGMILHSMKSGST